MFLAFEEHIRQKFPFLKSEKIVLAFSGGLDSVVLAHLLYRLKFTYALAHCNFKLREKESDMDEAFALQFSEDFGISYFSTCFLTSEIARNKKLSIQEAARNLRYEWFKELMNNEGFTYVLTAHHADDNLETFLINLSRGTGLEGLMGIPDVNHRIIRPLLPFSRDQIKQYALENGLKWREDSSNAETKYLRNKIRHTIIPHFKELRPDFLESFQKTIMHLQESDKIIQDRMYEVQKRVLKESENGILKISIDEIKKLKSQKAYLYELLKAYGFTNWNDVVGLLDAQSGKYVCSKTHRLFKDRKYMILNKLETTSTKENYSIKEGESTINFNGKSLILNEIFKFPKNYKNLPRTKVLMDKDLLKFPLTVRKWKEGDYFYPFGMKGKKKLSKFFKDQKLSLADKEQSWVVCSEETILWVVGQRLDDRIKITDKTKHILQIELQS